MSKRTVVQLPPPLLNQVIEKWGSGMAELRRHVIELRLHPSKYFDVNKHIAKFTVMDIGYSGWKYYDITTKGMYGRRIFKGYIRDMGHDTWQHSITRPMVT